MSGERKEIARQRGFWFVYESKSKCDTSKNQEGKKDIQISDLSEEEIKASRKRLIDELKEFGS